MLFKALQTAPQRPDLHQRFARRIEDLVPVMSVMAAKRVNQLVMSLCCAYVSALAVLPQPWSEQTIISSALSSYKSETIFLQDRSTWPIVRGSMYITPNFSAAQAASLAYAEFTFDVALSFNISIPALNITYQNFRLQTLQPMAKCSWNGSAQSVSVETSQPFFLSAFAILSEAAAFFQIDNSLMSQAYVHSSTVSAVLGGPETNFNILEYALEIRGGAVEIGNLWSVNPYDVVGKLNASLQGSEPVIVRAPESTVAGSPLCIHAQWQTQSGTSSSRMVAHRYLENDMFDAVDTTVSKQDSPELWIRIAYGSPEQYFMLRMLPHGFAQDGEPVSVEFTSGACELIPGGAEPYPTPKPTTRPDPTRPDDNGMETWQLSLCIVGSALAMMFLVLVAFIWQRNRRYQRDLRVDSATQPLLSSVLPLDSFSYTAGQVNDDHIDVRR